MSTLWPAIAAWSEPSEDWRDAKPNKFGKSPKELYGNVKDADEYFQGSSSRPVPWPQQSRSKHLHDYDKAAVHDVLRRPAKLEDVDPRNLKASQPSIIRSALKHYQDPKNTETNTTFESGHNVGNAYPVVYEHENGDQVILSGHHRAAKALFAGHPLRARIVRGGRPPR